MDFSSGYHNPGVYVDETTPPLSAAALLTPSVVALVGDSQRFRTHTERIDLSTVYQQDGITAVVPQPAVQLSQLGVRTGSIVVKDTFTGVTYVSGAGNDYTVETADGADGDAGTADDVTSLRKTAPADSDIPDVNGLVEVTYEYADPGYFDVKTFFDFDSVKDHYGDPFDDAGLINSPLSLAALLAITNGASTLLTVAVEAALATPTAGEWQTAIDKLLNEQVVSVVVPISGDGAVSGIHDKIEQHVDNALLDNKARLAILGRDGTGVGGAITATEFKTQAARYRNKRVGIVSPSVVRFNNGVEVISLGGEYLAAAVAGRMAANPPQEPLTRKEIVGFYDIPDPAPGATEIDLQRNGILVCSQRRPTGLDLTGPIVVNHGVNTMGTAATDELDQELSIQAARDALKRLLEDYLEGSDLIGGVITDTTGDFVESQVISALEFAASIQLIADYDNVQWSQPENSPTEIHVKFEYIPPIPLNIVSVEFAYSTRTGDLQFTDEIFA